ncbi:unnamed protein product [Acanthoscelides obtectus]|uniref:Kinesin motor domain-containing protein n=1 Tax=Acanthoscelides obtectus TaxID=200917 RepID=A0A9P0JNK0_ACAOB|nr:unnamed protein product [Acanthoscelides obtectus]CAK1673941.1 Kinesin-like protein KIF9 [Acanthoscelides obtectus]
MKNSDYADIKIFYRIFPLDKPCWDYVRIKDKNTIYVRRLQELNDSSKKDVEPHFWEFFTDGVFHNTTQEHIYSSIAEGLLEDLTKGYSATIAAYGQSGTGKSLTLAGLQLSSEDLGIAPRIAQDLFEYKKKLPSHMKMAIQISYVEFNENGAVDLLLKFPNEMDHWLVREKMTKLRVRSKLDALKTLFLAEARKRFADTNAYFSHLFSSVLTFHVTTKNEQYSEPFMRESRLHIIDMAGVDTVGNLASIFKPVKEIGRANVTKCDLTQLFLYLAKQKHNQTNIKERSNPLVYFLGNDLSARSMLRFIGHIKTLREDLPMTISMMRFGSLLKRIPPEKKIVEKKGDIKAQAKQLSQKLEQLQKEEMLNSILMNQDLSALNEDRTEHLQAIVQQYLANTLTEISVMNVAEVSMVFRIFKEVYNRTKTERLSCLMERKELTNANASSGSLPSNKHKRGSRASRGSVPSKGSVNKTRKSANKTKIIKGAIPEGKPFHRGHDQQNGVKMENAISNMSVTDKNMSPKPSSTHKDSRLSKSGQGSFSYMPKRKSRSLVNGKQSSVATLESISMPPVPEAVLENEEAWTEYKRQSTYKMLQAEYQANEVNIREAYNRFNLVHHVYS